MTGRRSIDTSRGAPRVARRPASSTARPRRSRSRSRPAEPAPDLEDRVVENVQAIAAKQRRPRRSARQVGRHAGGRGHARAVGTGMGSGHGGSRRPVRGSVEGRAAEATGCERRLPRDPQQLGVQRSRERGVPRNARERHARRDGRRIGADARVAEHGRHRDRDGERVRRHRREGRAPVPRLPHRRAREAAACRQDQGAGHRRRRDRVGAVRAGSLALHRCRRGGHGRQRRPARHACRRARPSPRRLPERRRGAVVSSHPCVSGWRCRSTGSRSRAARSGSRRRPRGRAGPRSWGSTPCGCPTTSSTRSRDTGAIRPPSRRSSR